MSSSSRCSRHASLFLLFQCVMVVIALTLLPNIVSASSASSNSYEKEMEHGLWKLHSEKLPQSWHADDAARVVPLTIALKHDAHRAKVLSLIHDAVSNPVYTKENPVQLPESMSNSPHASLFPRYYGQFLSKQEANALLNPSEGALEGVLSWLNENGLNNTVESMRKSDSGDLLYLNVRLQEYSRLFPQAKFALFHHVDNKERTFLKAFPQSMETLLPAHLAPHVAYFTGINHWPRQHASRDHYRKQILSESLQSLAKAPTTTTTIPAESTPVSAMSSISWSSSDSYIQVLTSGLTGYFTVSYLCPGGSNSGVYLSGSTVTCTNPSGQSFTMNGLDFTYTYQTTTNGVSSTSTQSVQNLLSYISNKAASGYSGVYYSFSVNFPYYYVSYGQLTLTQHWSGSSGTVLSRVSSNRVISPSETMTPNFLHGLYNWPQNAFNNGGTGVQSIGALNLGSSYDGTFSTSDLSSFYSNNGVNSNINQVSVSGGSNQGTADIETSLDVQYLTGVSPNLNSVVFYSSEGSFEQVLTELDSASTFPTVFSLSYGGAENEYNTQQIQQLDNQFQMLNARGVGFFISSGDSGAYGGSGCSAGLSPNYPASSPYVTSVGATQLAATSISSGSYCPNEVAASISRGAIITTGGGFSNVEARPSWQSAAVASYLSSSQCFASGIGSPSLSSFGSNNRAYPDISLVGHQFSIMHNGGNIMVDGTSASAPAIAGFFSMINQKRIAAGQAALGFVAPLLYSLAQSNPNAFYDVTQGDNSCVNFNMDQTSGFQCCSTGFLACTGYDAVTGLGSPRFDVLTSLLVNGGVAGNTRYATVAGCSSGQTGDDTSSGTSSTPTQSTTTTTTTTTQAPTTTTTKAPTTTTTTTTTKAPTTTTTQRPASSSTTTTTTTKAPTTTTTQKATTAKPSPVYVTISITSASVGKGSAAYGANPFVVRSGTVVTWVNHDTNYHTIVSTQGLFNSGYITPGGSYSLYFTGAGNVGYYDQLNGAASMSGTIQVSSVSASVETVAGELDGPSGASLIVVQPESNNNEHTNSSRNKIKALLK